MSDTTTTIGAVAILTMVPCLILMVFKPLRGVATIGFGLSFWLLVGSCSVGVYYAPSASLVSAASPSSATAVAEPPSTNQVLRKPAVQEEQPVNDTNENVDGASDLKRKLDLEKDQPGGAFSMPSAKVIPLRDLVDNYSTYQNRSIRLSRITCVDPGGASFLCVAVVDGRAIRIKAFSLGAATAQSIAEDLIGACKGTANLQREKCRFDVIIKPTNISRDMIETPSGTLPLIEVSAPSIEFIRPKNRSR